MKTPILIAALFFSGLAFAQQKKKDTVKTQNIEAVTLKKQVFKKQSDRFVYDVAASPVAKGSTAFETLKATPLVSSTDDKSLKILGKSNAVIYLNGRKTNMNPEAITELLKNTPAENISKIEVITVPGSEYSVESSEGIINIILKKKLDDGVNGNFRMSNNQNKRNRQATSASLNFRKGKLGISSNINGSNWENTQQYLLKNSTAESSNISQGPAFFDPNLNLGGYLNIDYALNDKSNIALSWNSFANKSYDSKSMLFNTITNLTKDPDEITYNITKSKEDARSYNNSVNLNYELKTDSLGSKLNLNVAYLNFKKFQRNTNTSYHSDENQNILDLAGQFNQKSPQLIDNYSATADYIQKFKNDFTISVGANFAKTKTDNDTYLENLQLSSGNFIKDENQSNHFLYDEKILGVYLTFEKKFSDKFTGKVGSRFENTNSEGKIVDTNESIKRNYSNLLPYLSLSYDINDKNNISYSFSSRIRRPSFWEINPVRIYLTPTNYVQNNPFVKASDVYNNEFTYMYKQSYFFIVSHSLAKDDYSQIPLQNGNEVRYIRTNFGDKQELSVTVGTQKSFFKNIFTTNSSIGFQMSKIKGYLDADPITNDTFSPFIINTTTTSFVARTNNTVRLSKNKDWFVGVNFFYVGPQIINIGTLKPLASLDLNFKKIWNDWTFNLDFKDILRTNVVKLDNTQSNGNYNYVMNDQFARAVEFSITYNFGNKKIKKVRQIDDASKDIKSRTR
jgi:hypothetical protein